MDEHQAALLAIIAVDLNRRPEVDDVAPILTEHGHDVAALSVRANGVTLTVNVEHAG